MEDEVAYGWNSKGEVNGVIFSCPEEPHRNCKERECSFAVCKITKLKREQPNLYAKSDKKIIEWKVIEAVNLEDYDRQYYTGWMLGGCSGEKPQPIIEKGLNSLAKEIIEQGFAPYGDIKMHTRVYQGANNYINTSFVYTKEFVKYEP